MSFKQTLEWLTSTTERRVALALVALVCVLYVPLAGNYGMWDPWETHYGEVGRQMVERNDFVSQWWPGSPQDRQEFWSKPVGTFWLVALGMKLGGLEWGTPPESQMVSSWRVEWASRLPMIVLSVLAIFFVWQLVRRLAGRRAGALSALILATSSQWLLVTRQVMTDMPFVAPMTIALCLAGLALLLPEEEAEAELPRGAISLGRWRIEYPRAGAFWGFVAVLCLVCVPQLVVISIQLRMVLRLSSMNVSFAGVVPMLPYIAAFLFALWWCARARNRRQLYLFSGYVMCGYAVLAKGPAGVVVPGLVLVLYLVLAGRWRDIFTKLELPRGILLFIATAFPWYHAMLIRHGMGFWNEFIGDNYVRRAGGRHGDRGQFDYYLAWAAYGTFPWSGIVAAGALSGLGQARRGDPRRALTGFALLWFVVWFATLSLVNTKFHHYILPALPGVAVLGGLFLDDVLRAPRRLHVLLLALVAVPVTLLAGRDLAAFPPRVLWLFNYDYVNMPGTGRPWPLVSLYGDRYEYGTQLHLLAGLAAAATLALCIWAARRREDEPAGEVAASEVAAAAQGGEAPLDRAAPAAEPVAVEPRPPLRGGLFAAAVAAFVAAIAAGFFIGPASPNGAAPTIGRWDWLLPLGLMLPFLFLLKLALTSPRTRPGGWPLWALAAVAVVSTAFFADKMLIELSPHWSQKHVIAAYYQQRKGPEEPLIAWQLYWRGENFYTRNAIYRSTDPNERTVFLGDRNAEKLKKYLEDHPGKRVFFIVERVRFETLRSILPERMKPTLKVVDESNNKLYLATAET